MATATGEGRHNGCEEEVIDIDGMVRWMVARIRLPGHSCKKLWNREHDKKCFEFVTSDKFAHLLAYVSVDDRLVVEIGNGASATTLQHVVVVGTAAVVAGDAVPQKQPERHAIYYFVRPINCKLTAATMAERVLHGTLSRGAETSTLMTLMSQVYAPRLLAIKSWPESVKKDLMGHFHKLMASLTEATFQAQGKTVLYLPASNEAAVAVATAAMNKEFVHDLEAIVIGWTRQIKEVVNAHDEAYRAEASGPLEEIQFWRSRTVDLSGIADQLRRPDVKRVVAVLEAAKSSYLARFESLVNNIHQNSLEAADNLKFLEHLVAPCEKLAHAEPTDICELLPDLLSYIRMIWTLSSYYNHANPDRVAGLLRKISNEIISRCCAKISLREVFDGDVQGSIVSLEESIQCGVLWKRIYRKMAAAIDLATAKEHDSAERRWAFEDASIFAQVDAFVQRCRDLIELCEGQLQFCRKNSELGGQHNMPKFGGTRGHEIEKALLEIQAQFEAHVDRLRYLDYDILDVKTSSWHDDYSVFKNAVKDLEAMYANVMNAAFDGVTRVAEAVGLLETFRGLAQRDAIQRCVEKKTAEAYLLFNRTIEDVRRDFDENRRTPPLRPQEPKWAGSALWAKALATIVEDAWVLLKNVGHHRPREAEEAEAAYRQFIAVLNDYKASRYKGWLDSLCELDGAALQVKLEQPLMRRGVAETFAAPATTTAILVKNAKDNLLECNFDSHLVSLFAEVQYWEKFQGEFSIPYVAHDICNQREKMRVMREHVMRVVRAYNAMMYDLSPVERRLFFEHVRKLDKRITQGLSKLTWATKGVVEIYVRDCCAHCAEVHAVVRRFKDAKARASRECHAVASLLALKVDKNVLYDEATFEYKQAAHRTEIRQRLDASHVAIKNELCEMYHNFKDGSPEVQREWREFVREVDRELEVALRLAIKRSLQELSRAINGDAKTEPQQLFGVKIVLENGRLNYKPTMIHLTHVVNVAAKEMISTIAVVPRLHDALVAVLARTHLPQSDTSEDTLGTTADVAANNNQRHQPSFYSVISNDEDMLKIVVQIMNGISSTATELQKYLGYWEKYKPIWEMDKEAYVRRYAKANRSLKNYNDDVTKYKDQQVEIQQERMTHLINFVQLDCSLVKAKLISHCQSWQQKLLGLLNNNGRQGLQSLHSLFETNTSLLTAAPTDLDELSSKLCVLGEVKANLQAIEAKIKPIEDTYATLAKFEVQVAHDETSKVQRLRTAWQLFQDMLDMAREKLDLVKVQMRRDLAASLEHYSEHIHQLRAQLGVDLPVSHDLTADEAMAIISDYTRRVDAVHNRRHALQSGLAVFSIEAPEDHELKEVERDLQLAQQIWTLATEWSNQFNKWKATPFSELNIAVMEHVAGNYSKKIGKLGRDIERWGVFAHVENQLQSFMQALPLIQALTNPALRTRHWAQLKHELQISFDEGSPQFTLGAVFATGLNAASEVVSELSANADKESAIEEALHDMEKRWTDVELDITKYKDTYHRIKSTEDLFQTLEDDSIQLSTIKTSKFYGSFKENVDSWECKLSLVSEVVDMLLTVQRKWLYLESIFVGSDEIGKQLPRESRLFQQVNHAFTGIMAHASNYPNAIRLCTQPHVLDSISDMDNTLDAIQKSLESFLESKRIVFPRLYAAPRTHAFFTFLFAVTLSPMTTFSPSSANRESRSTCRGTLKSFSRALRKWRSLHPAGISIAPTKRQP